jgi:hypothetical protein
MPDVSASPAIPPVPLLGDGTLPPLALLVRWLEALARDGRAPADGVRLARLPPGNGSLPDLLAAAGIGRLALAHPPLPGGFRWEGVGGGRIAVDGAGDDAPLHHGQLPIAGDDPGGDDLALLGLIDLARLEDASALRTAAGHGAAWEHILAAAGGSGAPHLPPLAGRSRVEDGGSPAAWNPLAFTRRALVSLAVPPGTAPWGMRDSRGVRHPVQVVEGPLGRELLLMPELGALEAVRLEPLYDPVPGCHWEVSRTVLDNGRVRVELDPLGQIVRLCWDGRFASWAGPAAQPLVDGLPLGGQAQATVLEEGPVRARLAVTRSTAQGTLHLVYTLHAHEDVLRIAASWDGEAELALDHPTVHRGAPLRCAGEGAAWDEAQHASIAAPPMEPRRGCRWARLDDGDGDGLLLASARPAALSAHAGRLRVLVERGTAYALAGTHRRPDVGSAGHLAHHLAVPGRPYHGQALAPALHLPAGGPVPWWVRRPEGWAGELLLAQQEGHGSSGLLRLPGAGEAWRCALDGTPRERLPRSPDDDGFLLACHGGGILVVRWR